jgi:hypothetical protein
LCTAISFLPDPDKVFVVIEYAKTSDDVSPVGESRREVDRVLRKSVAQPRLTIGAGVVRLIGGECRIIPRAQAAAIYSILRAAIRGRVFTRRGRDNVPNNLCVSGPSEN